MAENNINFNDKKINKSDFYRTKRLFKIDNTDADKTLISKKELYGKKNSFKYIIACQDHDYIGHLCINPPQMIGYVKCFDSNKTMSFRIVGYNL